MVHLGRVINDHEANEPLVEELKNLKWDDGDDDTFTASVYGSKFAAQDLPKAEMPEHEMPKEVVYRMIKWVNEAANAP